MVHVTLAEELIGNAAQKPQQKEEIAWKGNNKSVVRKSEGQGRDYKIGIWGFNLEIKTQ